MFDAVRNNKRIVQIFLALITLPFAFWGVDSYIRSAGGAADVARVGGVPISRAQFHQALLEQRNNLQGRLREQFDPRLLDQRAFREGLADELVNQSLLAQEATKQRMFVADGALRQMIAGIPAFQEGGRFSQARYEAVLAGQGMSPQGFEIQLRRDLSLQQLVGTLGDSALVSRSSVEQVLKLQTESRQIQELAFPVEKYLAQVKLDPAAVQAYYTEQGKTFEQPEQARVEYVVLSGNALRSQVTVAETEVRAAYESNKARYQEPEERRASHILITVDAKAADADKAKAKDKAADILKQVQANPAKFAELAKQYSQDPGSARQGGDLGFFGKGAMVRPFEEAVWSLKEGEVSGLVQSDFGWHIIRLTGIKGGKAKPFETVRAALESDLRQQAQSRKFAEAAEAFGNMVYEQSDSLQPVAEKFHLSIQPAGWITRANPPAGSPLANSKLLGEVFSEDALKNRRNTQAVEVAKDTLVAARVVEYKPASVPPLEAVRTRIEDTLKRKAALDMAKAASEAALADLKAGKDSFTWAPARDVVRGNPRGMAPQGVTPVFRLSAASLPGYTQVEIPGQGFMVYKLLKVRQDELSEQERSRLFASLRQQLQGLWAQEDVQDYLKALRLRYKVTINQEALMDSSER